MTNKRKQQNTPSIILQRKNTFRSKALCVYVFKSVGETVSKTMLDNCLAGKCLDNG